MTRWSYKPRLLHADRGEATDLFRQTPDVGGRKRTRRAPRPGEKTRIEQFSYSAISAVLSVTTFWSFLREFSPLEVCCDENNRARLSGELPIGLHVPLHLSIGQAHAGDGRICSECGLWKSCFHHHIRRSQLPSRISNGNAPNLRFPHGKVARTRAENSRMF
jgi:hypothetical protein